ncbi:hypothetical protein PPERSA_00896 [Pseudocohnilembus persalinus]|uniref:Rhomboid-like protease n=1 Tax=Pseudocohnilembus persalinus TaxID=266149 RepID=A0A0V0QER6_PSEPJ|nr:hypothetical protein PPERSA_00896 [Pseudocohnilembus persalinus]|eukprot:KRX00669.1 hypothetical protein PPERSA_00896 [Pseudocohnilembus persalinus]
MSNVHRLGDYYQLPTSNNNRNQQQQRANPQDKIPFYFMARQADGDPKQENFLKMLKIVFCPQIKLFSFTTGLTILIWVLFLTVIIVGGVDTNGTLLQTQLNTMKNFGCNNTLLVYKGEVYRLTSAIFLHWNFIHILFNSIALLSFLSFMENAYGLLRSALIFIIGGIGGNIFSDLCKQNTPEAYSAGASTSLFALIGAWIAFVILNWQGLKNLYGSQIRCMMLCMVMMNGFFIFMLSSISVYGGGQESTDGYGHLGGFLTGIWIGLIIPKPLEFSNFSKNCKFIGMALYGTWFLLCFVLFYTTSDLK